VNRDDADRATELNSAAAKQFDQDVPAVPLSPGLADDMVRAPVRLIAAIQHIAG
jgi:hypothetical protein